MSVVAHLQRGQEGGLWDFDAAILAHLLLALLLLVEKLALAADIAAIAFRRHILAQRADRLARDDLGADRRLNRDLEELSRDQLLEARAESAAALFGVGLMHDAGERIDRLAIH